MKNLYWIIQSVLIILFYCIILHFTFTFLMRWESVVLFLIHFIAGIGFVILFALLITYISKNYYYLECDLFD